MTDIEAAEVVKLLFALYPTQRRSMSAKDAEMFTSVCMDAFADLEAGAARAAITRLAMTAKWLPTIAEIREAVGIVHHGDRRDGISAWGDVLELHGFRNREALADFDPLVIEVCQRFGWIEWRTLWRAGQDIEQWHVVHGENESADRARFVEAYDKAAMKQRKDAQVSPGGKNPNLLDRRHSHATIEREGAGKSIAQLVAAVKPKEKS